MCLLELLKSSNLFLVGLACRSCIKWKKGFHIEWKTISLLKEPHPPFILNFEHLLFSCFHSWLGRNKKGFCMWNQMNSGMLLQGAPNSVKSSKIHATLEFCCHEVIISFVQNLYLGFGYDQKYGSWKRAVMEINQYLGPGFKQTTQI